MSRREQILSLLDHLSSDTRLKAMQEMIERGTIADMEDRKIIRRMFLDATEPKETVA